MDRLAGADLCAGARLVGAGADAIRRELGRGGQVYFLHNRVETIEQTAARICRSWCPRRAWPWATAR